MLRKRGDRTTEEKPKKILTEKSKSESKSLPWLLYIFLIVFIIYIVVPFAVYFSPAVRRHAVFLNYVRLSWQKNLSHPPDSGLTCTKNFYIPTDDGIKLGTWHIPSSSAISNCVEDSLPVGTEFNDQRPVFLYLHGNAGTRAGEHRVELYKLLSQKVNAHVIAFDYRGFGDSTNVSPTEEGLVKDTISVYNWLLKKHVSSSRVFIWGHSLGTGVSVAFFKSLSPSTPKPAGLILEAPFTKILDAARHHPLSIFHRYMPFFETLIAEPIGDKDTGFDSIGRISAVTSPLLVLHAEDDGFVPFEHGKKLHEKALMTRQSSKSHITQFVGFEGKFDYGHKNIYLSPDLPDIINSFLKSVDSKWS